MAGSEKAVDVVVDDKDVVVEEVPTLEDEELKAAEDALAVETEKGAEPEKVDTEVDKPVEQPAKGKKEEVPTVPVPVVTAIRRENQGLKERIAHLQGKLAVHETNQQTGDPDPAEKTPEEKIAELHQQRLDLAKQFDDAEITDVERETKRIELEGLERDIRTALQPEVKPVEVQPSQDLALEEHLRNLEKKYPSLGTATAEQLEPLQAIARQQYMTQNSGKDFPLTAQGTADLRTAVAKLNESVYGGTAQIIPSTGETKLAELSDEAKAREKKLVLAQGHPIDTSALGTTSESGSLTDEQAQAKLDTLSDDEAIAFLEANPALTQRLGVAF